MNLIDNHTVIATGIFKATRLKKSRVSQESIQSLLYQWILIFQVRATIAIVLDLQSQRVDKLVTLWLIDSSTRIKCLGDVKEALLSLEESVRLLYQMLVTFHTR